MSNILFTVCSWFSSQRNWSHSEKKKKKPVCVCVCFFYNDILCSDYHFIPVPRTKSAGTVSAAGTLPALLRPDKERWGERNKLLNTQREERLPGAAGCVHKPSRGCLSSRGRPGGSVVKRVSGPRFNGRLNGSPSLSSAPPPPPKSPLTNTSSPSPPHSPSSSHRKPLHALRPSCHFKYCLLFFSLWVLVFFFFRISFSFFPRRCVITLFLYLCFTFNLILFECFSVWHHSSSALMTHSCQDQRMEMLAVWFFCFQLFIQSHFS